MDAILWIAEQKIKAAIEAGELSDLPGAGRPFKVDADYWRGDFANHVLKNAGFLPRPLALRKRIEECRQGCLDLIEQCRSIVCPDENKRTRLLKDYRRQYKCLLKETNGCVEELAHYQIQQQARQSISFSRHSALSQFDTAKQLAEFDYEFFHEKHLVG